MRRRAILLLTTTMTAVLITVLTASGLASAQDSSDATITVNTLEDQMLPSSDDGKCSLREAILNADSGLKFPFPDCVTGSSDAHNTINFAKGLSGKITLASELPPIDWPKGVTIDGSKTPITVSGNSAQRVFSERRRGVSPLQVLLERVSIVSWTCCL